LSFEDELCDAVRVCAKDFAVGAITGEEGDCTRTIKWKLCLPIESNRWLSEQMNPKAIDG